MVRWFEDAAPRPYLRFAAGRDQHRQASEWQAIHPRLSPSGEYSSGQRLS